ncbi:MAG: sulfate adenylyltransferase, partial [Acutalibacteraceae bacterium]
YSVGDEIPTKGDSYSYPDSFDIIVLRDETAVRVRNKKITDIVRISDYKYDNYPLVNGRGFEVLVSSKEEFESFINEYYRLNDGEKNHFFAKWMKFDTYRKIVIAE